QRRPSMRHLLSSALLLGGVALLGCGSSLPYVGPPRPEVEITLDDGRASEQPLTPAQPFEMLIRVDPHLAAYRLLRLRFLLAHPGHIVFTVYSVDDSGRPGKALKAI